MLRTGSTPAAVPLGGSSSKPPHSTPAAAPTHSGSGGKRPLPAPLIAPPAVPPAAALATPPVAPSSCGSSGRRVRFAPLDAPPVASPGGTCSTTARCDDGFNTLNVRSGPQALKCVQPGCIPLHRLGTHGISTVRVGLMSIFDGHGAAMFWKGVDSIMIMKPKIGRPARGERYARYLGNITPGTLGRRRLEELAASDSQYAPYAAHFLDAVAFLAQRCPFIATGNLGLSVMLEDAGAASHFDKPDCVDTVRGLSVRLACGAAAVPAAATAAPAHLLRFTLHLDHEGHTGLVDVAAVEQIEHKVGAMFLQPTASGEETLSFVPTDAQRQASIALQRVARGRAVRVKLYHQRRRSALSGGVLHDHARNTFDTADFQRTMVEFIRRQSSLYPHGLTFAQTLEPLELPTAFRQEGGEGGPLVDCWCKGQPPCVRAKTHASRMCSADMFGALFQSLLDERAVRRAACCGMACHRIALGPACVGARGAAVGGEPLAARRICWAWRLASVVGAGHRAC